ncbi:MAG: DUF262 domain-containing protein [Prochlorotrichaceae cyanobacterium]|jgi:hypothetical protein
MIDNNDFDNDRIIYGFEDEDDDNDNNFSSTLDLESLSQTVVYGADWTVETLKNQIKKGTILLDPSFQRRDAWERTRKSRLIESLILGIPVPNIVLAEKKNKEMIVLDGKQRLLSILQFFGEGDSDLPDNGFKLQGLEFLKILEGETYQSLKNSSNNIEFLRSYENQTIRTIFLRNWPDETFLHKTFLRLNQGGKQLLGQELRLALYPAGFMKFIDEKSRNIQSLSKIFRPYPDSRMADSELLLRFLSFHFNMKSYRGGMKSFLDSTSAKFSEKWDENKDFQEKIKRSLEQFEESLTLGLEIFDLNFSKVYDPARKTYKSRFNKSIFDLFIHSFLHPKVRVQVRNNPEVVITAYENLFNDVDFTNAVGQATKSADATLVRFKKWKTALENSINMQVDLPVSGEL